MPAFYDLKFDTIDKLMSMGKIKSLLYFPVAKYFCFWAGIRLRRWKPRIVVVTGSSGKTTLLHMLEAQLGERAVYSHHANSAYGIPFFILDLHRKSYRSIEWVSLSINAILHAFKTPPKEKIFVVEADTDRWGEGKFLAEFLKPEVVLWTSVGRTHSMNFEGVNSQHPLGVKLKSKAPANELPLLLGEGRGEVAMFESVDEVIAYDFGYFLEYCIGLAVINADSELERIQIKRSKAKIISIRKKDDLTLYDLNKNKTRFHIRRETFSFDALLPEEIFYSIVMCVEVCEYFKIPFDRKFSNLQLPPGRSSIFKGIKDTIIIDSSYNANLSSMKAILHMYKKMHGENKWVVLGDMLELGEKEREEHERLGELLSGMDLERIILVGKRVGEFTYASLMQSEKLKMQNNNLKFKTKENNNVIIEKFLDRGDVLEYIKKNLKGGEIILFKGSQSLYLEDIIEDLLKNKKDAELLSRRGEFWEKKRLL